MDASIRLPSPRQTGLHQGNLYAYHASHRLYMPIEGTIVNIHFPADPSNRSQKEIEYDVAPALGSLGRLYNVPLAVGVQGLVDAEEVLLQPARLIIPSGAYDVSVNSSGVDTDGDRVLVQFLNGSFVQPVITHVLTHKNRGRKDKIPPKYLGKLELLSTSKGTSYTFGSGSSGSTAVDLKANPGNRFRHHSLNGTHLALDANGDVFVNFKAHPDPEKGIVTGNVTKKLVIQNEGKDLLRIEMKAGGSLEVTIGETFSSTIKVAVGDGAKKVAIADALAALWGQLKSIYDGHTHVLSGSCPTGPISGTALATTATAPAWNSAIESTKVKIPNG